MWRETTLSRLRSEWASLVIFSKREWIIWLSYRMNAWMWFLDVLINTTIFFMLSLLMRGSGADFFPYGNDYVTFVVLGLCVHYISFTNLGDPYNRVARIYWGGTMDLYLLSPLSYFTPFMGIMFRSVIDDYPRVLLSILFGGLLFGAHFNTVHLGASVGFLALTLLATLGLGIISASSFYLFNFKQQTEPVRFLIQDVIVALTAGYFYPLYVLPQPLQIVGSFIPHTYALDALRRLVVPGGDLGAPALPLQYVLPLSPIGVDTLVLVGMTLTSLPLGWFMYVRGIERARREGTLTRWQ
jgi:ABC-2 type transport system permease protein